MAPDVSQLKTKHIDLVTVSYLKEWPLLKLQARSIALYGDWDLISGIYIIINDSQPNEFKRFFKKAVLPEYGRFGSKVKLINYTEMFPVPIKAQHLAWRSQQALKLLAARFVCKDAYMVLDSKNHFIRPFTADHVFTQGGKLKMHFVGLHEAFKDHFIRACTFFGIEEIPSFDKALPTSTPFLMRKGIVLSLLEEMESKEQKSFQEIFMAEFRFNEFYLYYAYILARYKNAEAVYKVRPGPVVTLYYAAANNPERALTILKRINVKNRVYMMGIHKGVIYSDQQDVLSAVKRLWLNFGIVKNAYEFSVFIRTMQRLENPSNRVVDFFSDMVLRFKYLTGLSK